MQKVLDINPEICETGLNSLIFQDYGSVAGPVQAMAGLVLTQQAQNLDTRCLRFLINPGGIIQPDEGDHVSLRRLLELIEKVGGRRVTFDDLAAFINKYERHLVADEDQQGLVVLLDHKKGSTQDAVVLTRHHGELTVGLYARFERWLVRGYDFLYVSGSLR